MVVVVIKYQGDDCNTHNKPTHTTAITPHRPHLLLLPVTVPPVQIRFQLIPHLLQLSGYTSLQPLPPHQQTLELGQMRPQLVQLTLW